MAGLAADALRDALMALADRLDDLINGLAPGDAVRIQLEGAQNSLRNAAADVDASSIEAVLSKNADLQKLQDLTAQINARAAAIAASVANVNKITSIAGSVVNLGTALSAGSVPAILGAVSAVQTAVG